MARLHAGFGRTKITPPLGTALAGFGARTGGAQGVHDDLWARAFVIGQGAGRIGLVVCDLCEIDAAFVADVRARSARRTAMAPERLMVAATHTHAAPATFPLYSAAPDPSWLDGLAAAAAEAVEIAVED